MNKVYYLSTCDTCRRILKSLPKKESFQLQDIKKDPITAEDLDEMHRMSGSYESLFSKKAQQYKALGLKDLSLTETDFRHYLLEHYTFLNRPVFVIDQRIFIGSSPKVLEELYKVLS